MEKGTGTNVCKLEPWSLSKWEGKKGPKSSENRGNVNSIRESKASVSDFSGGPVVKNPPANAGVMGSIPGPGRLHMPQGD